MLMSRCRTCCNQLQKHCVVVHVCGYDVVFQDRTEDGPKVTLLGRLGEAHDVEALAEEMVVWWFHL